MSLSVNKKQASSTTPEQEVLGVNSAAVVAEVISAKSGKKDKNASMEAFSSEAPNEEPGKAASAKELREAAIKEATRYLSARTNHEDDADKASWTLIQLILMIAETFEKSDGSLDDDRFQQFLSDNGAKPRANAGSDYHRLAKACVSRGMKFSKLGGQIHALRTDGIRSDAVMAELDQRKPVKEGGPSHFGAHRFFLLYQERKREQAERDGANQEPTNPYAKWSRKKLIEQGKLLLEVIWKEGLLPSEFEGVEAALDAAAETE